jgi:hypothetical protein
MHSAMLLSLNCIRLNEQFFFSCLDVSSIKRTCMLDEVATHHAQRKRARTLHLVTEFLDDLPSSDPPAHSDDSDSSPSPSSLSGSSISSPSSGVSDPSSSPLHSAHSGHSSSDSGDFNSLIDRLLEQWDTQVQELATYLLTVHMLEVCPPVQKLGQLGLYLTNFRHDHPDRFRKKLRVSPPVFDRLVDTRRPRIRRETGSSGRQSRAGQAIARGSEASDHECRAELRRSSAHQSRGLANPHQAEALHTLNQKAEDTRPRPGIQN